MSGGGARGNGLGEVEATAMSNTPSNTGKPHEARTAIIRDLNDAFRQSFVGGQVMITFGVDTLPIPDRLEVLDKVKAFDAFTEDNDPHGEHDFGSFKHKGQTFFWKIDCYDTLMLHHSPDATDPNQTKRVLTIMMAEEY